MTGVAIVDYHIAKQKAALGDVDGAIELSRTVVDDQFELGGLTWSIPATGILVESLLTRNAEKIGGSDPLENSTSITLPKTWLIWPVACALMARVVFL